MSEISKEGAGYDLHSGRWEGSAAPIAESDAKRFLERVSDAEEADFTKYAPVEEVLAGLSLRKRVTFRLPGSSLHYWGEAGRVGVDSNTVALSPNKEYTYLTFTAWAARTESGVSGQVFVPKDHAMGHKPEGEPNPSLEVLAVVSDQEIEQARELRRAKLDLERIEPGMAALVRRSDIVKHNDTGRLSVLSGTRERGYVDLDPQDPSSLGSYLSEGMVAISIDKVPSSKGKDGRGNGLVDVPHVRLVNPESGDIEIHRLEGFALRPGNGKYDWLSPL